MSIDKDILFRLLAAKIKDDAALWLTRTLVYHDCTGDYVMRGAPGLLDSIAPHKTLFGAAPGKGLPIGNLNSQFFANVYLNGLDQFVKHELRCRHYVRYCDDFVLLADSPELLAEWRGRIEAYLHDALCLELNPRQVLAPASNGINFLGYIVRRDYLLVRRRVVNNLKQKLREFEGELVSDAGGVRCYRFDRAVLDRLTATLSSYLGHFKHANGWNLWQSIWRRFDFLAQYFEFDAANWRLERKFVPPLELRQVKMQYRHFRWRFPNDALFFRVGKFIEFYDVGVSPVARHLGLDAMRKNSRGARNGFPVGQAGRHLKTLLDEGMGVVYIGERANPFGGIKSRAPLWRRTRNI